MMSEEQCIHLCHKRLQPKLEDRCYSQWHAKKKMETLEESSCEKNLILLLCYGFCNISRNSFAVTRGIFGKIEQYLSNLSSNGIEKQASNFSIALSLQITIK